MQARALRQGAARARLAAGLDHRTLTADWHRTPPAVSRNGFPGLVEANHRHNFELWHEEDIARRDDLGAERVTQAKRAIDRSNQARNDVIEQIDRHLAEELAPPSDGVPFNSETPGMIIDRLSILALKHYHMDEEAERGDASEDHRSTCRNKLAIIERQTGDLALALDQLLQGVAAGTRSFRVYHQFKMYNDPTLNPELRKAKPSGGA